MRRLALILVIAGCTTPSVDMVPVESPATAKVEKPVEAPKPPPPPPDPWAGRTDLITPPQPLPARDVDLGAVEIVKLGNGMTLVMVPRPELPVVDVELKLAVGNFDEPADRSGISVIAAEMLREGTKRRSAEVISQTIEQLGGQLGADADLETTEVSCRALAKDVRTCMDLVADVTQNPTFPEEELGTVRDRLVGSVKQQFDQPSALAMEHAMNQLFGDGHPHGRVVTEKTLAKVDRASVIAFHNERYAPAGSYLSIAGSFDVKAMRAEAEKLFGSWKKPEPPRRAPVPIPEPQGLRVLLVDKPGLNQAQIRVARPGIAFSDADRLAVELMNYTLGGGGFSSRLVKIIRSEKGKTYGINSSFEMLQERGSFRVSTSTRTAEVAATLRDVLGEIERYRGTGPAEDELTHAKGHVAGAYPLSLQRPHRVASLVVDALRLGLDIDYVKGYARKIDALSQEDVRRAAAARLDAKNAVIVIVGDGAAIEPELKKAGFAVERIEYTAPISARERQAMAAAGEAAKAQASAPGAAGEAQKLVGEAIAAMGGEAALRKIKDVTSRGEATMRMMGQEATASTVTQQIVGRGYRSEMSVMGMTQTLVVGPDFAIANSPMGSQEMPPAMAARMRRQSGPVPGLGLIAAMDAKVSMSVQRGVEKEGKKVDILTLQYDGGDSETHWFDAKTHQLLRTESGQGSAAYSDWRAVNGVQVPFTVKIEGARGGGERKLTEVKFNTGVNIDILKR